MSSNNEYAIQVQDVSKIYKLYDKPIDRLKESLSLTHKNYHKDFFALSDISFNVKKGETVGIIGTNDIKDHHRSADPDKRTGPGEWSYLGASGAGSGLQHGLHRH